MEVYAVVLAVLLLLSGVFSSAETAFLSVETVRLEHARRRGLPGAARAAALLEEPRRLLAAILLGNNLVNTGAAAVGTAIAAELLSGGSALLAATVVITVLLVIFGEIGPKSVALHHNMTMVRLYAWPLRWWVRLTRPLVAGLDALTHVWLRVVGESGEERPALSLGELETAIDLGRQSGELEASETSVLLGALRLSDTQVRRIMTPRVQIVSIEADATLAEAAQRFGAAGFLRLPVSTGSADRFAGYLHGSDVLAQLGAGRGDRLVREVMREALFESERASVQRVLEAMRTSGHHLMLLIDEYGATSGLITLEDILELVVGNIRSEMGRGGEPVQVRISGRQFVEGRRGLTELAAELELDLSGEEAETVAGMLTDHFHRIPRPNEELDLHGYRWTVVDADERRVKLVSFRRLRGPARAEADER